MATQLIVRKWGNSLGVVFPRELVQQKQIKANEAVIVEIVKRANLRKVFGTLPRMMSGQAFKDMVRKGWD